MTFGATKAERCSIGSSPAAFMAKLEIISSIHTADNLKNILMFNSSTAVAVLD